MNQRRTSLFLTRRLLEALLIFGLATACDEGSFKDTGEDEKKVVAAALPASREVGADESDTPVAHTVYDVRVNANTGMELCRGQMSLLLSTDFDLKPKGLLKCLMVGDMDLAELFGGKKDIAEQDVDMKQFPGFGKIIRSQNPVTLAPGHGSFTPPKPSLIGPLIQDASVYEGFSFREPSQVRGITKAGEPYQSRGEWFMQVHGINQTHRPETYQGAMTFDQVIHWEIRAAGFQNAPKTDLMAFESMAFYWNTNPIAVPEIQIKMKLADLGDIDGDGSSSGLGGIGDMIFSGITIRIRLIEHNPI